MNWKNIFQKQFSKEKYVKNSRREFHNKLMNKASLLTGFSAETKRKIYGGI